MGRETQFRLKQNVPDIEIVDGPFAGRTFKAGEVYAEIPPAELARFDMVEPAGPDEASVEENKGGEE
ncbi:MAG: hypothetical protein KA801_10430 [Syntrophorhabdaceae bacterium]|nr:hypothetical protein [Syntrophorhabdaceae bacterium]